MLMSMMCVYVCACYAINHLFLEVSPAGWQETFWSPASQLKVSCQPATGILIRKWHFHGIMTLSYNCFKCVKFF